MTETRLVTLLGITIVLLWVVAMIYVLTPSADTPAAFGEEWKCTKRDVYYTKKKLEKFCKQWTRIK